MAIRPLIDLSKTFTTQVKTDNFASTSVFVLPRIVDQYNRLSVTDRLRVFGIIMERNFFKEAAAQRESPEKLVADLEWLYGDLSVKCQMNHIRKMNETGDFSEENIRRTKIFGCIPAFIAVDLADAIETRTHAAHTSPSGPV